MASSRRLIDIGRAIHDRRWWVIAGWLAVAIALNFVSPDWESIAHDGDLKQLPAYTSIAQGEQLSRQAFPNDVAKSQFVLVFARRDEPLTIVDREFALELGNKISDRRELGIVDIWNEKTPVVGDSLRSPTGYAGRIVLRIEDEFMATENIRRLTKIVAIVRVERSRAPAGLEIGISGSAAIGGDMLGAAAESVADIHLLTIIIVAATLILIYRSPWLMMVPLVTIGLATSISIDLLALLASFSEHGPDWLPMIRLFTTTKIFIIVLLFGSGTDFTLFLMSRFREERALDNDLRESVARAFAGVAAAVAASAFTTIVGLAMMGFAEFGKFAYSGPTIGIALSVALLACLSLVPALLSTRLGLLVAPEASRTSYWQRFWERLANFVIRRPYAILLASFGLAIPLAWIGWNARVTYDLLGELPSHRISRQGTDMLRRYFPLGEIGPVIVLAEHDSIDLATLDGQLKIAELTKKLADVDGVTQVRSLYQPMGDPPGSVSVFSSSGWTALASKESPITKAAFVSDAGDQAGKVTRLFLILDKQPFSNAAVASLNDVEGALGEIKADTNSQWHEARFALAGPTVGIRDLESITTSDRWRIQGLVTLAVFLVILLLLRKPAICLYLMATVLLGYLVTMGITSLVFEQIRGDQFEGLDWKVPLFLFVLLVAVGQDYNILLVSRVFEEQRTRETCDGLRIALVRTGGIITSCGVIMAGTFVAMTTSELNGMVELGFALTLGILLDTFVVRTILVPAFLALLAGKNSPQ